MVAHRLNVRSAPGLDIEEGEAIAAGLDGAGG